MFFFFYTEIYHVQKEMKSGFYDIKLTRSPGVLIGRLSFLSQILVVKVLAETGSGADQAGHMVGDLLDTVHLLLQELIQEVSHVVVALLTGQGVQIDDGLVDLLFQLKSCLHAVET